MPHQCGQTTSPGAEVIRVTPSGRRRQAKACPTNAGKRPAVKRKGEGTCSGWLLARAAARVPQLRLTHLALLSLGLGDLKGAAAHVLRLIHFVVRQNFFS